MLVKTYCAAVNGMEVTTVTVEVSITRGVLYHLTGLADVAVKESHDRIAAALLNVGYKFPVADITAVSYTHLTLPTTQQLCRSRWSPYH